jgi:DNA-binding PadR family transcriptional regulator
MAPSRPTQRHDLGPETKHHDVRSETLAAFGRYAGPATLILSSLADGPKHGYGLTKDIEGFAEVRIAPGTMYEALARLERQGLIEALASTDRRRPYRLTAEGALVLRAHLDSQRRIAEVGLRRLTSSLGLGRP